MEAMRSRSLQLHPGLQTPSYSCLPSTQYIKHLEVNWYGGLRKGSCSRLEINTSIWEGGGGGGVCITGIPHMCCRTAFKHPRCSQNSAHKIHTFCWQAFVSVFTFWRTAWLSAAEEWTHTLTRQPRGPESKHLETHNPHLSACQRNQRTHGRRRKGPSWRVWGHQHGLQWLFGLQSQNTLWGCAKVCT